jgi:transposase-like protein
MATGKPRDERKEQHWRQRIRDWQDSGLSIRAFCARRGLSQASFYAWRRELQRRDSEEPLFVPIRLRADDLPASVAPALEVLLANGRRICVAPGFDAATLRQVLAVLEEGPPC